MHPDNASTNARSTAPRRKRPHPARRARRVAGAGSFAVMIGLAGGMAVNASQTSSANGNTTNSTGSTGNTGSNNVTAATPNAAATTAAATAATNRTAITASHSS